MNVNLDMFSIAPAWRGKGKGRAMLGAVIAELPANISLRALCSPYAKPMKHLLRSSGFLRQRQSIVLVGGMGLDLYVREKGGLCDVARLNNDQ
ncbi:hypothetical protein JW897_11785 [Chromobacterium alkanivorans]|nr:hypothetical protein [Chromobacterium alkanivorans]MBN3004414.1 hypothetical protein [Chromobacterium alkanivorans]